MQPPQQDRRRGTGWLRRCRWTGVLGCLLLAGCLGDLERNNPLDPLAPNFEDEGGVRGQVTSFYPPFQGLFDVEVRLTPGPYLAQTDPQGQFALADVPAGRYRIEASREGYAAVTDSVTVTPGVAAEATLRLDGLPTAAEVVLTTGHLSRWWPLPQDLFSMDVAVRVDDPDGLGDVDSVWIELPEMGFSRLLQPTPEPGRFTLTLAEGDLPMGRVHALLGRPFVLALHDRAGYRQRTPPALLARVIDQTPVARDPEGLVTLPDPAPDLHWESILLPFPFTYRVEIVRVEANIQTLVQVFPGIDPGTTRLKVPVSLASGSYFWTVSVVDEFGNWSRSKEAGFLIP